jgi:hypothetical protein
MKIELAGFVAVAIAAGVGLAPIAAADSGQMYRVGGGIALSPVSQQNAVRKAQDYLELSGFSQQGLIKQLEYDNFSADDATFAVETITVDWNEQAAKKAKDYLDLSAFSHGGLINQLEYDGFTPDQAAYGTNAAGL